MPARTSAPSAPSANKDGKDWVLNGRKVWQSGAGAKDNVICLYARTDLDAHYRQGMSLFLVDNNRPGITMKKLDMLGRYCMGTYEVTLENVRVPEDQIIGGVNKGWDCLLSGLQTERITVAACDVGSAQGVVDLALDYAKERKQFGRAIGNFQSIAHMLADMQTEVEAARSLMYRAAWMVDAGKNAMNEINMAKLFASEVYVKVANLGMHILRRQRLFHGISDAAALSRFAHRHHCRRHLADHAQHDRRRHGAEAAIDVVVPGRHELPPPERGRAGEGVSLA